MILSSTYRRLSRQACRWLAGLEAGVWAGLGMLGWFALTAAWSHHPVWEVPNWLGSLFYGPQHWRQGFYGGTLAGLAFHLFTCGVVGILFGCLVREAHNRLRVRLLGMVTGLSWCYLAYAWFWKRLLPPGGGAPPPWLLAAYLVFGVGLGCYPGRLRCAERHFLGETEPAQERTAEGAADPPVGPSGG